MRMIALSLPFVLSACNPKDIGLGGGSPVDARLIADLYTWTCTDYDTGTPEETYEGVFSYGVTLEYAPDDLENRDLPSSGCSLGLDLFPADAGATGTDIPDATPSWINGEESGELSHVADGFYKDDVFENQRTCTSAADLLGEGTTVVDAGVFSDATTPKPESYTGIEINGEVDVHSGLSFGDTVEVSWQAEGWDATWLQIRREEGGALEEAVTCNATGEETYTIGADVWDLFDGDVETDVTNLYVGVQRSHVADTDDGQKIETVTRVMHSLVIDE